MVCIHGRHVLGEHRLRPAQVWQGVVGMVCIRSRRVLRELHQLHMIDLASCTNIVVKI